jgi:hypothetical protein
MTAQVTVWPNRGRGPENAALSRVAARSRPSQFMDMRGGAPFSGRTAPDAGVRPGRGALFVVFRPDPAGLVRTAARRLGRRSGRSALGIMTDAAGAVHAILRRNANGTSWSPPTTTPAMPGFQVVSITWGPNGVVVSTRAGRVATRGSTRFLPIRRLPRCGSAVRVRDQVPGSRETWRNCEFMARRWATRPDRELKPS